ncbi:neugrin [Spinachia spinachia]
MFRKCVLGVPQRSVFSVKGPPLGNNSLALTSIMSRAMQVLCRLGAQPCVSVHCRRPASSRGAGGPRTGPGPGPGRAHRAPRDGAEMSAGDSGAEEVEDKLQALAEEERKGQRTLKYHILRRQMSPAGAPERKLSWDAIEQIRYLKQEQPEEWTVERLAEGYSVTPDVILRVLRSKHVPTDDRKAKQDAKVKSGLDQRALPPGSGTGQNRLKPPGHLTPAALSPGRRECAVVPVADRTMMLRAEGPGSLAHVLTPAALSTTRFRAGRKDVPAPRSEDDDDDGASKSSPLKDDKEDEHSWDGQMLTDKELEEFMEMEKPHPVVQVGNEVFDGEGNFLYRI